MKNTKRLKYLFQRAVKAVPYPLTSTGETGGSFAPNPDGEIEYYEEFTFPISSFFGEKLFGYCCIELRQDGDCNMIRGSFIPVLDEDWDRPLLSQGGEIQGEYNLETKAWFFEIYNAVGRRI